MNWDVLDQNLRLRSEGKDLGNGVKCFRARGKKIRRGHTGTEYKCLEVLERLGPMKEKGEIRHREEKSSSREGTSTLEEADTLYT